MTTNDPFQALAARLEFPDSSTLSEVLALLVTAEEAEWLLALPATPSSLADRFGLTETSISRALHDLYMRGLVIIQKTSVDGPIYQFPGIGQLMDHVLFDDRYDALGEPFLDLWRDLYNKEFVRGAPQDADWGFRVIPVETSIEPASSILPYEQAGKLIQSARRIAVQSCPCRKRERRCHNPLEMCISLNDFADYILYRELGRELTVDEALALLQEAEERGLIHEVDNIDQAHVICNCCSCCCVLFRGVVHHGLRSAIVKSRFRAQVSAELCTDCGLCLERCHFGALVPANGVVTVDAAECYGCGSCATVCPSHAITLREVREPSHIPLAESDTPMFVMPGQR